MEQSARILKEHNLKVTPQRLLIYKYLYNSTSHPSAEIIYNALKSTYPTMSLATVYKTMDTLIKSKLVSQINVGEDSFRYDADMSSHTHFICSECGGVFDLPKTCFEPDFFETINTKISADSNFKVHRQNFYFYGVCPQCQ